MLVRRPDLALIKDEDGKNPLHTAATKGRVQVLREVFSIASAQDLTPKGENALHVAVKHNQYKAMETLIQLAVKTNEASCIGSDYVEVNAVNSEGLTALDITVRSMAGSNEPGEIQEVLRSAGAQVSGSRDQAVVINQRQQALAGEDQSLTLRTRNIVVH
ncbi:ankyrin repeat-containing protein [Salix suchowensis]|nr:ankyrin repeat-containing protein [Salix suchowensis]